jgi:putative transposase
VARDEYIRRTVITRALPTEEAAALIDATIAEYKESCQIATDMAWPDMKSKSDVQPLAYDTIREETNLTSQHAILATHQTAEAITGCHEHDAKGRNTSKPTFTADTVTYDSRTMTLFDDGTVSLSTVENRVRIPLDLPKDENGYQHRFIDSDEWELTESTLTRRGGSYYIHLGFRRFATDAEREAKKDHNEDTTTEDGTVLGVDLGVANLAVTSTGLFISGDELTHWQNEYEQRRTSMQQTGTRWAHIDMQRVGRKEESRFTIILHEAANAIVDEADANDCTHIAFEKLDGIRDRLPWATWHHRWAFRKVYEFVSYKAVARGISVRQVNPKNTSRQCSRTDCGFTHPDNRPCTDGQDEFCCLKCGYEVHADYNAAKNIAVKYAKNLHRLHTSSDGGAPVDVPLNSGLLTIEGPAAVVVG